MPSLLTAGISDVDAQARATSSMTMHGRERVGTGAAVLLRDVHGVEVGLAQRVVRRLRELARARRPRRRAGRSCRRRPLGPPRAASGARRRGGTGRSRSQDESYGGSLASSVMTLRLTVLGTGYLGATHAASMAELGFEVLGVDVDEAKIAMLADGRTPFYEPGLEPLLQQNLASGRLRFTTSYEEVAAFGDVHFLCVGTPQRKGEYAADLRYVDGVVDGAGPAPGPAVPRRRQVDRAGRHRRAAARPADRAGAGRRAGRAGVEPGVPPRGLRRRGHAAPGPARGRRHQPTRAEETAARGLRDGDRAAARRSSSPTSPPPSWSRCRPTRSWPRRSRSSTRWPRCARRPAPT